MRSTGIAHCLQCWRCGADLERLSLPLGRRDECPACLVELHVCKMCVYFDLAVTKACREDDAEEVKEKERANFCDYFKPSADAYVPGFAAASAGAEAQLANLFSDAQAAADTEPAGNSTDQQALDDLFKE